MKILEIDERGNVNLIIGLVTTSIVLYTAAIILGKMQMLNATLSSVGNVSDSASANFNVYMQLQNLSVMVSNAMTIASIGLLILAAIGILSYFGVGLGGSRGRGKRK
jgi:predicted exporter